MKGTTDLDFAELVPGFPRLLALWTLVVEDLATAPVDLSHDALHLLRVCRWALRLAPEAGVDPELAGAAALVHDLDPAPKEEPEARREAGRRAARAAGPLLEAAGFPPAARGEVTAAVADSNWSSGKAPAGALGRLLADADRLDALGALGIARCFACGQAMAARRGDGAFYHPGDPAGTGRRELDDGRFALDHFRRKLLRLAGGMHFQTSRSEALRRQRVLEEFRDELLRELDASGRPE